MQRRNRDFAVAVLSFIGLWACANSYIFLGKVNSFGTPALPNYAAVRHIWEMVYQEIPVRWTAADIIRAGYFPAWTPYPEMGTPLIGKMQNGIFYPFHILYYLSSVRWRPWAFTAVPFLSQTFAFACLYLFAQLLGLPFLLSLLASAAVVFSTGSSQLSPNPVTALFLPVLLALAELYHREDRWRDFALWLLPPVTALAFFAGHFETAFRISAMAGLYFVVRSFQRPRKNGERLRQAASFAGAQALGVALAAVQILPGMEYVRWSYNRVWRSRLEYRWIYHTIGKHLGLLDIPLLALGLGSAAALIWLFRQLQREKNPQKSGGLLIAAVVALGIAVAALTRLGLDATASGLFHGEMISASWRGQFSTIFLFLLALSAAIFIDFEPGFKALSALFALGMLIEIKTPPLSNLIASIPIVKLFDNTQSTPALTLSTCFLAAAALALWGKTDFQKRKAAAVKIVLGLILAAGGWGAAHAMEPLLTRVFPTAIYSAPDAAAQTSFMGPESAKAFTEALEPFRAWSPLPCISAVVVAVSGQKVRSAAPAEVLSPMDECDLYGLLPMPAQHDDLYVLAKITLPDGSTRILNGPQITTLQAPLWPLAFAAVAAPLTAIFPPAGAALYAASAVSWAATESPSPISPHEFPFQLPGVARLKTDRTLFRIDSFDYSFLEADYANLYGISDIRNGGDNLDVLPAIYFNFLAQNLLGKPADSAQQTAGLRLLGLANVKYFVDAPDAHESSPYLKEVYRGPDMSLYQNTLAMPRAAFFPNAVEAPIDNILDWDMGRRLAYGVVPQILSQPGFDPQKTLILSDPPGQEPSEEPTTSVKSARKAAVRIVSYEPNRVVLRVQAPKNGYVLLSDNDFPGWKAAVNGSDEPIYRADLTFRAVRVPAGRSDVVFSYRPFPLEIGTIATALGMILWLVLFLLRGPSLKDGTPGSPESALNAWTARALRRMILGLVVPAMAFWILWTLFVFNGGIQNGFKGPAPLFGLQTSGDSSPASAPRI